MGLHFLLHISEGLTQPSLTLLQFPVFPVPKYATCKSHWTKNVLYLQSDQFEWEHSTEASQRETFNFKQLTETVRKIFRD